jgi:MFS family permease
LGTGWSRSLINGGLSLGLLTWGVLALPVGMYIQRCGSRTIMTVGSLVGGVAFAAFGLVTEPWHFYLAWMGVGAAMAALLYEPAFAEVTVAFGSRYKKGIVLITLLGGLASTVFIPLSHSLAHHYGWRHACIGLGIAVAGIGVPLHALRMARHPVEGPRKAAPRPWVLSGAFDIFKKDFTDTTFLLLALWFTAHTAAFSGLIFLIVPAMVSLGTDPGALLGAMALIGPMQVLGRLLIAARGEEISSIQTGRWAMICMILSLVVLISLPPTFVWLVCFAVLFGAGNGVMTIVKATAIAEFFGRERYAELNGAIAAPAVIAKAASPLLLSILWEKFAEPKFVFVTLLCMLTISLTALGGLSRVAKG